MGSLVPFGEVKYHRFWQYSFAWGLFGLAALAFCTIKIKMLSESVLQRFGHHKDSDQTAGQLMKSSSIRLAFDDEHGGDANGEEDGEPHAANGSTAGSEV